MAKRVVIVDDVSGEEVEEGLGGGSVEFSFDGKFYTIDLGVKNRDALRADLKKWIDAATEVEAPRRTTGATGTRRRGAPAGGSGRGKEELAAIRDWSAKQGRELSPRGRIPADVLEAFDKAHAS